MNDFKQTFLDQNFVNECHANNIKGSQDKSPFLDEKDNYMDSGKPYVDPKVTKLLFNGKSVII